jgi:hypothetical protein
MWCRHAPVVPQFELCMSHCVIPKRPRFYQRAEGSPVAHSVVAGAPFDFAQGRLFVRLKNGYAQSLP